MGDSLPLFSDNGRPGLEMRECVCVGGGHVCSKPHVNLLPSLHLHFHISSSTFTLFALVSGYSNSGW